MRKCLDYQGIARRNADSVILYDKQNDTSAMVVQDRKRTFKVIDRAIQREEASMLETSCEAKGHYPSNVSLNECDCGFRRFDD